LAPARIKSRRDVSELPKRQLRTAPSVVKRVRSQSPQNGRVTEAITPILPRYVVGFSLEDSSSTYSAFHNCAGAETRGSSAGVMLSCASKRLKISSEVTHS